MVKRSKAGNLYVISYVLILLLVLISAGIISVVMKKGMDTMNPTMFEQLGSEGDAILTQTTNDFPTINDRAFTIVFVGYWLVCLVAAYIAPEHPITSGIIILLVIVLAFIGGYVSNIWDDFAGATDYEDVRAEFPMTDFILSHYVEAILLIGFSSTYLFYYSGMTRGLY